MIDRRDACGEQRVDQPVVEVEPRFVDRARAVRLYARPGDREPVAVDAELAHQRNVFAVAMVVVAGDVAGVAVVRSAGRMAEGVPDRGAAAVFGYRTFDLVRRGGHAELESGRKVDWFAERHGCLPPGCDHQR